MLTLANIGTKSGECAHLHRPQRQQFVDSGHKGRDRELSLRQLRLRELSLRELRLRELRLRDLSLRLESQVLES